MNWLTRRPSRNPNRIRVMLRQLCSELSGSLGADLQSIVLYGNFARTHELETENDTVNVMIVSHGVNRHRLDKMAGTITRVEKEIPLTAMILTRDDLHSSCDVFPIKFHDMQLHHRVLIGEDVLSDLEISDDHLRLRCEQQLKNLMLRMRATYVHGNQNRRQLLDAVLDANQNLVRDMHACLLMKSGMVPDDVADVAVAFGNEFGLDTSVVDEVMAIRINTQVPQTEDLKATFDRLMQLVHDAALAVDQMETLS